MVDDDPCDDVVRVDRADLQGEGELGLHLLLHRALHVRGHQRPRLD